MWRVSCSSPSSFPTGETHKKYKMWSSVKVQWIRLGRMGQKYFIAPVPHKYNEHFRIRIWRCWCALLCFMDWGLVNREIDIGFCFIICCRPNLHYLLQSHGAHLTLSLYYPQFHICTVHCPFYPITALFNGQSRFSCCPILPNINGIPDLRRRQYVVCFFYTSQHLPFHGDLMHGSVRM